ncbi:MAG: hypothetical protein IPK39_08420 [Sulfuritalea sp.]|nr:hypothetical protein [Sulfuritalea sp.]
MLEHRRALLVVDLGRIGARQAAVEGIFDCKLQRYFPQLTVAKLLQTER